MAVLFDQYLAASLAGLKAESWFDSKFNWMAESLGSLMLS